MLKGKITRISFSIAFAMVFLMWAVFLVNYRLDLDWYQFGILPHEWSGLKGILFGPFLHSTRDMNHILNNSGPMFILTWLLFYHYRTIATPAFLWIYFLAGLGTWLLGESNYHIGMSGVIYGLTSFLVFSGFFRKNMRVAAISLFVVFIYGSLVWGIFPIKVGVSWEGHLSGLVGGIMVALFFKEKGPQPAKMRYEVEEDLGIEPELEYWKEDFVPPQKKSNEAHEPKVIIQYRYQPKSKKDKDESE